MISGASFRKRRARAIAGGALVAWLAWATPAAANPYNLAEVPRMIPPADASKLLKAGLHSTDELLTRAATPEARQQLADKTGLRRARIDQLVRDADFLRLYDIGPEFAMLLEAAGVKSAPALAKQAAPALTNKLAALNRARRLVNPAPTEKQVRAWIAQAAKLPPLISPG